MLVWLPQDECNLLLEVICLRQRLVDFEALLQFFPCCFRLDVLAVLQQQSPDALDDIPLPFVELAVVERAAKLFHRVINDFSCLEIQH